MTRRFTARPTWRIAWLAYCGSGPCYDVSFHEYREYHRRRAGVSRVSCTLVKPQFEAPAALVGEGGIVTDPAVRRDTLVAAIELFAAKGLFRSTCACRLSMALKALSSFSVRHRFAPATRR
ncbi:MAG: hypothetical protein ACLU0O_04750 [Collinsella sp.]